MNFAGEVRSSDGTTNAFERSGEGPPIIMVGGATEHRAINPTAKQLVALLAPHLTVITYDRRGRARAATPRRMRSSAKPKTSKP